MLIQRVSSTIYVCTPRELVTTTVQLDQEPHYDVSLTKFFFFFFALLVYESSAKYPSSDMELGNFDQCMNASSDSLGIRGAYALVRMRFRSVDDDVASKTPGPQGQGRSRTIEATVDTRVKAFDNTVRTINCNIQSKSHHSEPEEPRVVLGSCGW